MYIVHFTRTCTCTFLLAGLSTDYESNPPKLILEMNDTYCDNYNVFECPKLTSQSFVFVLGPLEHEVV